MSQGSPPCPRPCPPASRSGLSKGPSHGDEVKVLHVCIIAPLFFAMFVLKHQTRWDLVQLRLKRMAETLTRFRLAF
jgi:hypothetical protein